MKNRYFALGALSSLLVLGCEQKVVQDDAAEKPATPATRTPVEKTPASPKVVGKPAVTLPPAPPSDPAFAAPPDVAAPPADAEKTASGLAYKVLQKSEQNRKPAATDLVRVNYTGWKTDGSMFDSSHKRGRPAVFEVGGVIPGWIEGLQLMNVGEKWRFWIPQNLAYDGRAGPPAGMLVFDVELLDIVTPVTPKNVAKAPKNALVTDSGLASVVLEKGTGQTRPTATSMVEVHYSGWTTDGELFDTSAKKGTPARFPLNRVIAGWTEGVQLMVQGEKRRFWIPEKLAYGGRPGKPAGMLVFDIELVGIK